MAAKKLFFCLSANQPHQPHFKAKVLLNVVPPNEASKDDYRKTKGNHLAAIYEYGLYGSY